MYTHHKHLKSLAFLIKSQTVTSIYKPNTFVLTTVDKFLKLYLIKVI